MRERKREKEREREKERKREKEREREREREKESLPTTNYHAFSFPKECFADIGTVSLKISDFHYNS